MKKGAHSKSSSVSLSSFRDGKTTVMSKSKPKRPTKIDEPIPKPKPVTLKADISKSLIKTIIHSFEK